MVRSLFTVTVQFRPNLSLYRAFSNVHSDKIYGHQLVGEINIDTEREMSTVSLAGCVTVKLGERLTLDARVRTKSSSDELLI